MAKYLLPSYRQQELVKLLIKYKNYKDPMQQVADRMHISKQAVKNMLMRIRDGYVQRMKYIEWYRKQRKDLQMPGRFL